MSALELLWALLVGHAVADFALQSDTMAKGKNWNTRPDYLPPGQVFDSKVWLYWMGSHSLIHGGAVAVITGSVALGVFETAIHFAIDCAKCAGFTGIHSDQALHLACKAGYVLALAWVVAP